MRLIQGSLLLLLCSSLAHAKLPYSMNPKATEVVQKAQLEKALVPICVGKKVPALEQFAQQLRNQRFADGSYQVDALCDHVGDTYPDLAIQWATKFPKSDLAHLAAAEAHIDKAWKHRGRGWANSVTAKGWQGFHKELSLAAKDCQAGSKLPKPCPGLYAAWLVVAKGESYSEKLTRQLFDKAIALDPVYRLAYRQYAIALLDRWGGTLEQRKGLVNIASKHFDSRYGKDTGYAVVYICMTDFVGEDSISDELGNVDVGKVRNGTLALSKKMPYSAVYPSWHMRSLFLSENRTEKNRGLDIFHANRHRIDPGVLPKEFTDQFKDKKVRF